MQGAYTRMGLPIQTNVNLKKGRKTNLENPNQLRARKNIRQTKIHRYLASDKAFIAQILELKHQSVELDHSSF